MRTQNEILAKIEEVERNDFFGAIQCDLLVFLNYNNAKPFLKDSVTEEDWKDIYSEPTEENIKKQMNDYLSFAFVKARNERGISASISLDHYYAWIWLLDKEDYFGDVREYSSYGLHHLKKIEKYLNKGA